LQERRSRRDPQKVQQEDQSLILHAVFAAITRAPMFLVSRHTCFCFSVHVAFSVFASDDAAAAADDGLA
jgi:hypothetical protein